MPITITVFARSPDEGRGLARDMPVRWALEEAGLAYDVRPIGFDAMKQPAHRRRQPFGQIPVFEDGEVTLFESGAIVLHVALHHAGLLPDAAAARARATGWLFAAVATVEPPIVEHEQAGYLEADRDWLGERLALAGERIAVRLGDLADALGEADWLDGAFSAGDLMMIAVLRRLGGSPILAAFPSLVAYVARGEARPAFRRAFAAQRAQFLAAGGR